MKILIFGCGETARLAHEYFMYDPAYADHEVIGFCANTDCGSGKFYRGLPVVTPDEAVSHFPPHNHMAFAAAGSGRLNRDRAQLMRLAQGLGYRMTSYVSSFSQIWHDVELGPNSFIMENCILQSGAQIGSNVVLWTGCNLAHGTVIEDHAFLAPSVTVCGFSRIGSYGFIGARAVIGDHVNIGSDNMIALGAAVYKDTEENAIYQGVPACKRAVGARAFTGVEVD